MVARQRSRLRGDTKAWRECGGGELDEFLDEDESLEGRPVRLHARCLVSSNRAAPRRTAHRTAPHNAAQ